MYCVLAVPSFSSFLVLALAGAVPSRPYSSGWAYYPCIGLILVIVLVLVLLGRV
jgi:hypothetical protein